MTLDSRNNKSAPHHTQSGFATGAQDAKAGEVGAAPAVTPITADPHASQLGVDGASHRLVLHARHASGGSAAAQSKVASGHTAGVAPDPVTANTLVLPLASFFAAPVLVEQTDAASEAETGSTQAALSAPQAEAAASAAVTQQATSMTVSQQVVGTDSGGASGLGGALLPSGYLSTKGNQIVDANGNPVRIASIGWDGTDSQIFAPYGLYQSSIQQNMDQIKADGFNTIRIPWTDQLLRNSPEENSSYMSYNPTLDPELVGATSLQLLGVMVADAGKDGLKVIFDHHDDETGDDGWGGQQANGLWIDSGPGTNGTDGAGHVGTVNAATFQADTVELAQNFAGNSTVIGFDLDNEPSAAGDINWGQGGPTDIHAMYTTVGDAVQAVDPGALIIAEGPQEYDGPAAGMPAGFGEGDLSGVATDPVSLNIANKVVYSVHEYPPDLSGNGSYTQATQISEMNAGWGYLETGNIAPVWVGEMGSDMTSSQDSTWIQNLLNYMNGEDGSAGGPTFSGNQEPVSGSWWQWGNEPSQDPDGVETAFGSGVFVAAQQAATDQLLYESSSATLYLSKLTLQDTAQSGFTSGQTTANLWSQLVGNGVETNPNWVAGVVVSAVGASGTLGSVNLNAASQTITYTAPAYNPYNSADSFTYTLSNGHGESVTGTVDITETAPSNVIYGTVAGASLTATSSGMILDSLASGETQNGSSAGGDTFLPTSDTTVLPAGNNDTVTGGAGNRTIKDHGSNATVNLGNGNNTIYLYGSGNVVTAGTGNNTVWKPTGSTWIGMGNGNETITVEGPNNSVSLGSGTSSITMGTDGNPAGDEQVTVAGGTNAIYVGGAYDGVTVQGGTGNSIHSSYGSAAIHLLAGSSTVIASGNANVVTAAAGTNTLYTPGNNNSVTGGSGADTIWAGGTGNTITGGSGTDVVSLNLGNNTVAAGTGFLTVNAYATDNTFVLGVPGEPEEQIYGNLVSSSDLVDLRQSLFATNWNYNLSVLGQYLSVTASGTGSIISIDPDGTGSKPAVAIADLQTTSGLTLQSLIAHAIIP